MNDDNLLFADEQPCEEQGSSFNGLEAVNDSRKSIDVSKFIQPKTVTFARYKFSKLHMQMFIHIREELSAYVSRDFDQLNPKELIRIPLFCSHYPHFNGSMKLFYESIKSLMLQTNVVSFRWKFDAERHAALYRWMMLQGRRDGSSERIVLPRDGAEFEQTSVVIVNIVRSLDNSDMLLVDINPLIMPFILYYGKGNGGTLVDRDVALRLRSVYSQRFYERLVDWSTSMTEKRLTFDELREFLFFPDAYTPREIKRWVLSVAQKEIEEAGSDVVFDFEFKFDAEVGFASAYRGPIKANCVIIHIKKKTFENGFELAVQRVQIVLKEIADREKRLLCADTARLIVSSGKEQFFLSKVKYYFDLKERGKIRMNEYKNTLLKIVREMCGVELRSDRHVQNSQRANRKYEVTSEEPRLLFE